jgi:hypothetical protein
LVTPFLEWLSMTPVAGALKGSATLYLFVNAAHILSIGLVIGAIVPLDLRILGFFGKVPVAIIEPFLARAAAVGVGLAIVTGALLFSVRPLEYAGNTAFLVKLCLVAFGVANALLLQVRPGRRMARSLGRVPVSARVAAFLSLVAWVGAVLAGRWIGFL